jgi:hypothetical protein
MQPGYAPPFADETTPVHWLSTECTHYNHNRSAWNSSLSLSLSLSMTPIHNNDDYDDVAIKVTYFAVILQLPSKLCQQFVYSSSCGLTIAFLQ